MEPFNEITDEDAMRAPLTAEQTLERINRFLDMLEPFMRQLPQMVEEFQSSPIGKMLGIGKH